MACGSPTNRAFGHRGDRLGDPGAPRDRSMCSQNRDSLTLHRHVSATDQSPARRYRARYEWLVWTGSSAGTHRSTCPSTVDEPNEMPGMMAVNRSPSTALTFASTSSGPSSTRCLSHSALTNPDHTLPSHLTSTIRSSGNGPRRTRHGFHTPTPTRSDRSRPAAWTSRSLTMVNHLTARTVYLYRIPMAHSVVHIARRPEPRTKVCRR